ncbi:hypothetical protein PRIPAC_74115 [Pristionchus pacificus]|uniref:Uncharacterized protein n=1 Tax=Pristionchus pacificus TaxID=54126 RepID=A0A2A6C6I2_PRIPA|nr:hypothetical protein PRIPAC_74115 [Pristionchus pacificus]|eukprot:PDM73631.1 hypothetical protein PRIPAC_40987 [Pristionchus pacificus]
MPRAARKSRPKKTSIKAPAKTIRDPVRLKRNEVKATYPVPIRPKESPHEGLSIVVDLPSDEIIREIMMAGHESVNAMRLISQRWNRFGIEHQSGRSRFPPIKNVYLSFGFGLLLLSLLAGAVAAATICKRKKSATPTRKEKSHVSRRTVSTPRHTPAPSQKETTPPPVALSSPAPAVAAQSATPSPPQGNPPPLVLTNGDDLPTAIDVIEDLVEAAWPSNGPKTDGFESLREEYRKKLYREREEERTMTKEQLKERKEQREKEKKEKEELEKRSEETLEQFRNGTLELLPSDERSKIKPIEGLGNRELVHYDENIKRKSKERKNQSKKTKRSAKKGQESSRKRKDKKSERSAKRKAKQDTGTAPNESEKVRRPEKPSGSRKKRK